MSLPATALTPGTQRTYRSIVRRAMERPEQMRRGLKKASLNYQRLVYYACRRSGVPPPLEAPPRLDEAAIHRPVLSREEVQALITWAMAEGDPETQGLLALATTYGLRRGELLRVRQEDVDWRRRTIRVWTAKGGVARTHLIPEAVAPWLEAFPFAELSLPGIHARFRWMCLNAGISWQLRLGWHAIRRALVTELVWATTEDGARLPEMVIANFMRWKVRGAMLPIYFRPDERYVDEQVFAVHPFLPEWKEKGGDHATRKYVV